MEGLEGGFILGRREGIIGEVGANCWEEMGLECLMDIVGTWGFGGERVQMVGGEEAGGCG